MPISGILFDIGDTLLDATRLQRRALEETARSLANEGWMTNPQAFINAYQLADREPQFAESPDLNHLYSDARIIERAFERLSWPVEPQHVERFLQAYRERLRANIRPDAALREVLDALKARGFKLGIVSNGTTREQLDQLTRMEIKQYFDPILISQEVGIRKPDPRIFLLASKHWKLPPEKVLVVGDRGDWEAVGARRAGMKSALTTEFVNHREKISQEFQPDLIIGKLSELPDVLGRAGSSALRDSHGLR